MSAPADQLRFVPDAPAASTAGLSFVPDAPAEPERPAPTQPAEPPWRPSDPLGAALYEVAGPISSGIAGSLAGGGRAIYDLATGKGLEKANEDIETEQERTRFHPRTAVGAALEVPQAALGHAEQYLGNRAGENTLKYTGSPALAATADVGAQIFAGAIAGKAIGAGADVAGRVARRAPYTVEAESTAPRGPTTVEGQATPINRRPGLPNPNPPQGGAGGAGAAGGGPEPKPLPYHPADPTVIPARLPGVRRVKGQSASGLRDGRMLDPVVIDGRTGEVIDHPALPKPERPVEAPEGGSARQGEASESSGGTPPPEVPIDTPPIGDKGLPNPARGARAAILRRVGFTRARLSAVAGNALDAADDYWVTRVNQPAGVAAKTLVDAEWPTLVRHGQRAIAGVGGTYGTDEGALEGRGQTLTAPADALRDSYRQRKQQIYDTAKERAATMAPTMLQGVDVVLDNPEFAEALGMRDQQGFVTSAKKIMAYFRGLPSNAGGFKPDAAEAVSKWFNQQWTPDNAWAIRQVNNAIREDVAKAAGEDVYKEARDLHAEEQRVLGERTGISRLFETDPENPDIRAIPHEQAPGQALKLPLAQFRQLVDFYSNMPDGTPLAVRRTGQAALAELRSQFINELLAAGSPSVDEGAWSTPKVNAFLKKNGAKFEILFRSRPGDSAATREMLANATQQVRDLISAGRILRINRGYPGASVQGENVFKTGVVVRSLQHAAGAAGLAAGEVATGGLTGGVAGAALGEGLGNIATRGITRRQQMQRWDARVVNLDDIAPPEPGAPPTPAKKPRGPRKPPSGGQPAAAPTPQPTGPTPTAAAFGGPAAPAAATSAPAAAPAPATPAPTPAASTAPATPPAATGAFPAQGYTRAGYDRAQLAQQLGVDPRAVGERVLMLHQEAEKATQAGDEARARALIAERDSLVNASLAKQGLPPKQPPPPPNTLASTEAPPAPAAPATPPPTLASTEGSPASAPKAAPVATGPTLASVGETAPPAPTAPPGAAAAANLLSKLKSSSKAPPDAGKMTPYVTTAHYIAARMKGDAKTPYLLGQEKWSKGDTFEQAVQQNPSLPQTFDAAVAVARLVAQEINRPALTKFITGVAEEVETTKVSPAVGHWEILNKLGLKLPRPVESKVGMTLAEVDAEKIAEGKGASKGSDAIRDILARDAEWQRTINQGSDTGERSPTPLNTTPPPKLPGRDE